MSFNGSGTFVINSTGQPVVTGTVISSSVFNALTADLANGLSGCITKDGQTTITNNIPFGGYRITGVGLATTLGDALSYGRAATVAALSASGIFTGTAGSVLSGQIGSGYSRTDAQLELRNTTAGQHTLLSFYQSDATDESAISFQGKLSDNSIPQMAAIFVRFPGGINTAGSYNTVLGLHNVGSGGRDKTTLLSFDNNSIYLLAGDTSGLPWNTVLSANTLKVGGDIIFPDATYDIGKSGATRPRDGFFSRNMVLGGTLSIGGALTYGGTTLTAAVLGTGSMMAEVDGTWTPAVAFGGGTTGITYSTQTGYYKRIGNLVWLSYFITLTNKGSSTGAASITGLPLTSNAASFGTSGGIWSASNFSGLTGQINLQVARGATTANLLQAATTGTSTVSDTNFTNTTTLIGTAVYSVGSEV